MSRRRRAAWALGATLSIGAITDDAGAEASMRVRLFADTDDDDRDGRTDRDGSPPAQAADVLWFEAPPGEEDLSVRSATGEGVRVIADDRVIKAKSGPVRRVGLQGLSPGTAVVDFGDRKVTAFVCEVWAEDLEGRRIDLASSHASLSRTLPPALAAHVGNPVDADALRWRVTCPSEVAVQTFQVRSFRANGAVLDTLELPVSSTDCPERPADACGATPPLRAVVDDVDREHPASAAASIKAEVGGLIVLSVEGRKAASIRVGGPRHTARGAMDRYRGRLDIHVVRQWPGGAPPIGGDDQGAALAVLREVRAVDSIWGQCGIVFGPVSPANLHVEDPPGPHLIAVGCQSGLPASGGQISLSVEGAPVQVPTAAREPPVVVASRLAQAIRDAGYRAKISTNARTATSALRTVDVLVERLDGTRADVGPGEGPLSTDPTLSVCIGEVDLSDGLDHFGDLDAAAGTLEERTLIKGLADDDPTTIDVFIIGSFSRTGRIGESFIDADRSSIQNAVIVDRAGIRAGARSYALPHELGHVLLDMPGHPDDFGVDRPWMLMDADAADPTIFGPRRLPTSDCERALRQSGSDAPMPLLVHWPLIDGDRLPETGSER